MNEGQLAALTASAPVVMVTAGPGTGKTRTLVERIAWLVEQQGIRPEEITAVTFTNQAASEMRSRLEQRLGGRRVVAPMTIGTFHAICLRLLGDVSLISQGEALTLADDVLRCAGVRGNAREFLQAVSRMKNSVLSEEPPAPELVEAYGERLQALGVLDFDDLLSEALKLDAAGRRSFHHLLVDEFQDLNDAQYELVQAWYRNGKSLFVIGDPDQSIYGFRGASGRCFQRLRQAYPDAAEIHLAENYRSAPAILQAAASVIHHNSGGQRTLLPHRPEGPAVRLVQAADGFSEAVFIAKEINRMTGGVDMLEAQALGHEREARAFSDIAVLCRTHRQLELVEKCLRHDDIPCVVSGREDYLEDSGVRGMLAFLHMLQVPADGAALETALRLLWDCPADLVEKVRPTCQMQTVFDPELFREIVRG